MKWGFGLLWTMFSAMLRGKSLLFDTIVDRRLISHHDERMAICALAGFFFRRFWKKLKPKKTHHVGIFEKLKEILGKNSGMRSYLFSNYDVIKPISPKKTSRKMSKNSRKSPKCPAKVLIAIGRKIAEKKPCLDQTFFYDQFGEWLGPKAPEFLRKILEFWKNAWV